MLPANQDFIQQELQKFNVVEANLTALAEAGKGLTISGIDDKNGLEAVKKARIAIKNERVRITKTGKELRDQANAFNKAVLAKEKEYLAIITPTEDALQAEEDKIQAEKDRIERERVEAEQKKVHDRINQLSSFGFVVDYSRAIAMTDEQFTEELASAKASHEAEEARKVQEAEAARIEAARLAEEKAKQDAQALELKKQQDAIAEERRKIEEEKRAIELRRELEEKAAADRKAAQERHEQELKDAEAKRLRDIEAAKMAEQERIEKAAAEARRQAALAPDKDKLKALADQIDALELPSLSMPDAEAITANVRGLLTKVSAYIREKTEGL